MTIRTKIELIIGVVLALALVGGWLCLKALAADNRRLELAVETAQAETQKAIRDLRRERTLWQAASAAITTAARVQGEACRADAERRALIDEIGHNSEVTERPKGSIDEKTSRKVVDMLNNSLFAPLGRRVRETSN